MKKIQTLSFIFLLSTVNAISQKTENNCLHKDLIRDFVNLADSMSRFMDNTKAAVSAADWEGFTRAFETGEEKAFEYLGRSSEKAKATFTALGSQLAAQKQKIYRILKTNEKTPDTELREIIDREINCYFSDTVENNVFKLAAATGKLAPAEIGMFNDCVTDLRNCLSSASAAHSSGLNNCISMATGGGGLFGWIGAIIGGGSCFINVESTYNTAKIRCARNFSDCMGAQ